MKSPQSRPTENSPPLLRPQGADPLPQGGVRYRLWAPQTKKIEVVIYDDAEKEIERTFSLNREEDHFFSFIDPDGKPGELYKYRLDGEIFPDPFSRWQPRDVWNASMIIDSGAYEWKVPKWKKIPLRQSIIYELHVGTFTPKGTFLSAIDRLDSLVELGVTTVELMPVADFPGKRNWGYDGTMLFAPDSTYGHPDDLRKLVDAIHLRGLNIILDVVYNHFGPAGNHLAHFSPHYFDSETETPWGDAIRFSGQDSRFVREIFLANVAYWFQEFRIDGLRLDATHEIIDNSTPHILQEIARTAHEHGGLVIAEDDRNLASLAERNKGIGIDGLWADDFHHALRVSLTGEREGYFQAFSGTLQEMVETLQGGWYYRGQIAPYKKTKRGTPPERLELEQFIHCISNHDQIGNRAFGERLHHLVSPEAYRVASALLCLTPGTPMLFMGQEWGASSPFLYFTDHQEELGKEITKGRAREFAAFLEKIHREGRSDELPDPQAESTFLRSKLQWDEIADPKHSKILLLYKELLQLRATSAPILKRTRDTVRVHTLGNGLIGLGFQDTFHSGLVVLINLDGEHRWEMGDDPFLQLASGWVWRPFLSTNEPRFGGDGLPALANDTTTFHFTQPEVLLLKPQRLV